MEVESSSVGYRGENLRKEMIKDIKPEFIKSDY